MAYTANAVGEAQITIRATDRFGATVDTTFKVTVANHQPTASIVLSPDPPGTNATLTATATGADQDGDAVNFTYVWKVNGTVVQTTPATTSVTDTLDLSQPTFGDTGDTITVEVTPNDGTVNGALATATTIVA